MSVSLCARKAKSLANSASRMIFSTIIGLAFRQQRLKSDPLNHYFRYTLCSRSLTVWLSMQVKKRLLSTGANLHSSFIPFKISKGSDAFQPDSLSPFMSSWKGQRPIRLTNLLGQPNVDRNVQKASLLTVSNTLAMSMKMVYRSKFYITVEPDRQ